MYSYSKKMRGIERRCDQILSKRIISFVKIINYKLKHYNINTEKSGEWK